MWADCTKSAAGAMNNASRTSCFACQRVKNTAKNPPPALSSKKEVAQEPAKVRRRKSRNKDKEEPASAESVSKDVGKPVSPAADKTPSKKAKMERKRQRRAEKRKEKEQPAAVDSDSEEEDEFGMLDAARPLAKDEVSFLANMGINPASDKLEVSKLFSLPKELSKTDDPEKEVTAASGRGSSKGLEEAEANVSLYQQMVEENKVMPGRAHLTGVLEQNLKEWREKVESLSQSQTGGKAVLSDLKSKMTTEEAKEDKRLVGCEGRAKTAKERYERLRSVLVSEQNKLNEKLLAFDHQFVTTQAAWSKDATARAEYYQKKMDAWNARIDVAKPAAGASAVPAEIPGNNVESASPAVVATPPQPHADYHLATKWSLTELPTQGVPDKQTDLEGLTILKHNLQYWTQCGMFPMTFIQMVQGCADTSGVMVAKGLLGQDLWTRMYVQREVTEKHIVPVQLVSILQAALGKVEGEMKADQKRSAVIQKEFDAFYEKDLEDRKNASGAYGYAPW